MKTEPILQPVSLPGKGFLKQITVTTDRKSAFPGSYCVSALWSLSGDNDSSYHLSSFILANIASIHRD